MACNNSAVIDVLVESKEIPSLIRDSKDFDHSSVSSLDSTFPPSLDSFNSLQEKISALKIDDDRDLCVSVDNPQKICDTLETYVAFRVTTKTSRVEFEANEYIVRRRYNDFVWLRQKLSESHPFCIIPPLPAKHTLVGQLDRYSRDFVLLRMRALNVFLKRIAQHPILSCNEYFKTFITAKQGLFDLHRKQKTTPQRKLSTTNNRTCSNKTKTEKHAEFDQTKSYLSQLQNNLNRIERTTSKINKEKTNTINDLSSLPPVFAGWAMAEPDFSGVLRHIGRAIDVSAHAESDLTASACVTVSQPIKELLSYVEAVQEALRKRETCQKAYEYTVAELNRRQSEKDRLLSGATASTFSFWKQTSNDDRLTKVDSYIPQLLKHVETNQDTLECANECLRSDLKSWQREKDAILRQILHDFVGKQLEYHVACANAWQQAMHEISASSKK